MGEKSLEIIEIEKVKLQNITFDINAFNFSLLLFTKAFIVTMTTDYNMNAYKISNVV